ncbi:dynein intermediate chain, putative [Babesia ovis]|uniref:Dynein intermediate chain, putative n=1 Tax=Babesia ovis TaxID=5869 RepID=A0A9W5T9K4_BABOV|nr:dynein intermediate chain, putative [Babesia ovis]
MATMEFSVMASSQLQPSILACGTKEGDVYILDAFKKEFNRIELEETCDQIACTLPGLSKRYKSVDVEHHRIEDLVVERYSRLFKSGVACMEYHPRLPSVVAVGLNDGSVHLLFVEPENPELKRTIFLFKFAKTVEQLQWLLVDDNTGPHRVFTHCSSFANRIWARLARAPYVSLLFARSGEDIMYTKVERKFTSFNLEHSIKSNRRSIMYSTKNDTAIDSTMDDTPMDSNLGDSAIDSDITNLGKVALIATVKWPQEAYFYEDIEHPTLTNFCIVHEALCVMLYHNGYTYLQIYVPVVDDGIKFNRFSKQIRTRFNGVPTSVVVSPKQYNQMTRYMATNNVHMFTLNGESCLNALGEFIAIASDQGYIYTTSMLNIYNRTREMVRKSETPVEPPDGIAGTTPGYAITDGDTIHSVRSIAPGADCVEINMASYSGQPHVMGLEWALLWNDYTQAPEMVRPDECCCTKDITFLLAVHAREHVDILRLTKPMSTLQVENHRRIDTISSAIHWVEDTLPNDSKLLMATPDGTIHRTTWTHDFTRSPNN